MSSRTGQEKGRSRNQSKTGHFKHSGARNGSKTRTQQDRRPNRPTKSQKPKVAPKDRKVIIFNKPYDTLS
ncbi:23S rRNA pseudouridylate synthase, partial [Vibrio alginolyticus]